MSNLTTFVYTQLEGCSTESYVFVSNLCINNRFQYNTQLSWMIITLALFFSIISILIRTYLKTNRTWTVPCSTLVFASLVALSLFIGQLAYFLNARGAFRLLCLGLCVVFLYTGITFVMYKWFDVVLSANIKHQNLLQSRIKRFLIGFNVVYQVLFWPPFMTAGEVGFIHNMALNNLLVGSCHIWVGISSLVIGSVVIFLGYRISNILQGLLDTSGPDDQLLQVKKKVVRYSAVQSIVWISGGFFCIIVGILGISQKSQTFYYYYIYNFWFNTSMSLATCLMVYIAYIDSGSTGDSQRSNNSIDLSNSYNNNTNHNNNTKNLDSPQEILDSEVKVEKFILSMKSS